MLRKETIFYRKYAKTLFGQGLVNSPYVAQLEKSGGGGFFPNITVSSYLSIDNESTTVMTSLDSFLKSGDVCGLSVVWFGGGGHAITCWGFTYNTGVSQSNKNYYTGVWISDSDDNYGDGRSAPDVTRYCPITWSNIDQAYILTYDVGAYGYMNGVVGLAAEPGYNPGISFTLSVYDTVSGETVEFGTQTVFAGGVTLNNVIGSGGGQIVSSGGVTSGTVINSGGSQVVSSFGAANSTAVNLSGCQIISSFGTANSSVINSGGSQLVFSVGTVNSTVISSGGCQTVYYSGMANSTTVNRGGSQLVSYGGAAVSTMINDGGEQNVSSGGMVNFTKINSGGSQLVLSGGVANSTTINSGGQQYLSAGGTAGVINQQAGAAIMAYTEAQITGGINTRSDGHNAFSIIGGAASNFLLESGGQLVVLSGNYALDTLISSGGQLRVSSGGMTNLTTINYSGRQYVSSGGVANSTTIISGGQQYISSGGTTSNTIVNLGGSMYVSSGGIVTGALTVAGGDIILASAASVNSLTALSYVLNTAKTSDVLVLVNSGVWNNGTAAYSLNLDNTAAGSYILADGVDLSGLNSRTFSVTDSSQTVNLNVGSSYTFSNGDKLSLNFTDSTRDQLVAVLVAMPKITVTATDAAAGEPGNDGTFRISRTGDISSAMTVYFNIGGSATSVDDYTLKNGNTALTDSVVIAAGQSYVDVTLDIIDDIVIEGTETAIMNLTANATYILGATAVATVNIRDDDDTIAPTVPSGLSSAVAGKNVAFDWADSSDAGCGLKNYLLEYALNEQFTGAVQNSITISDADVSGLADGIYYWRVQSVDNADNASIWGVGGSFTVDTVAPSVPATLTETVIGSNVAFDWADTTDATSGLKKYLLEYALNGQFSAAVQCSIAVSDADVSGLADGVYYWRVQSVDNTGNASAWGNGGSFLVDTTAPVPTGLTRTVTGRNVALDWADSSDSGSGLKNYLFEYALNEQFTGAVQRSVTSSNTSVSSLADGVYYWRVQTVDNVGNASAWAAGGSFAVDTTAPDVPSGLTRTLDGKSVIFDWNDAFDATSGVKQYQIEIDINTKFSVLEYFKQVAVSQASVGNLAVGTHYWRVRTQDNSGNLSSWSAAESFTVELTPPTAPGGLKQTVTGNSVAFDWNDSTDASYIRQYELRADNNSDFSSPEYTETFAASQGTGTSIPVDTYYWQVRAQDNAGNYSAWSKSSYFIITPTDTAANDYKTAGDISTLDNWVGFGDAADVYKLIMINAGTLTLGLTGLSGDSNLSLLDNKGKVLKTSANKGNTAEAITDFALLGGTYYVNVAPVKGVNSAAYILSNKADYCPMETAGNTLDNAGILAVNGSRAEWVGFGDAADFYKLTLNNNGTLSLNLTGLSGDANLSLLDVKGKVLQTSSNKSNADENISRLVLFAGDYFVKVAPADGGKGTVNTGYTLSNAVDYFPEDTASNTWQAANDINEGVDNRVGFGDPADYYKLTVNTAGSLTLNLTGLNGDANLSLLDNKGKVLKTSANKGNTPEAISMNLLSGIYYVNVAPVKGVNDVAYTLSNAINYFDGDTKDNAGNNIAAAKLADGSTQTGWVGLGDSDDYYRFDLTASAQGTLRLYDLAGGNADLSLYDASGKLLKKSAKLGQLEDTLTSTLAAGTYYARVNAVSGNIDYKLDFSKKDTGMLAS